MLMLLDDIGFSHSKASSFSVLRVVSISPQSATVMFEWFFTQE
jgi:hypothetical protein